MTRSPADKLADYEHRYRQLADQLADIGLIASGSITHRYTRCGSAGCRCHADPPQRHGPYWQWTAKVNGKTVTRRLTKSEASLYQQWIDNDRQLRAIITKMRQIAAKATELQLREADDNRSKV
jgi:alkanesulfonate monooxygenase SsuD/methylene tetrahydromethanopterin reductase-like flavin-dependent oxidoreductase (luciferase family)